MIRINKPQARKMYNLGHTITLVPCKCGVDNIIAKAEISMTDCDDTDPITFSLANDFQHKVTEFEYYNCNKETGYYSHYYVTEEDMESYKMCKVMCGGLT